MLPASFEMLAGVLVLKLSDVPGEAGFVVVDFVEFKVVLVIVEWRK